MKEYTATSGYNARTAQNAQSAIVLGL